MMRASGHFISFLKHTISPTRVVGLERLTLVAVKVVFPDGAALTFVISPPYLESLLSLSEQVEEVE